MKDYDCHFILSGTMRIGAKSKEEAEQIVNELLHEITERIDRQEHINVHDVDPYYVTDVVGVDEPW